MRECCRESSNRERAATDKEELECEVCLICGARHWTLNADKGELLTRLKGAGGDKDRADRQSG